MDNTTKKVTVNEVVGILDRMINGEDVQFGRDHAVALTKAGFYLSNTPMPLKLQEAESIEDQLYVIGKLFNARKQKDEEEEIKAAKSAFASLQEDELEYVLTAIRSMVLGCDYATEDGFRCDINKDIAETTDFGSNGKAIAPWSTVDYFNPVTGQSITADEYKTLTPVEQNNYEVRRYLTFDNGGLSQTIHQFDKIWISVGIAEDIKRHPSMIYRYIYETRAGYQGSPESGMLYDYRSEIADAIAALELLEFAKGKIVWSSITQGIIKSRWHVKIATLVTMYFQYREDHLAGISDDDIERYLDLIEDFTDPSNDLSDNEISLYRDASGDPLPGVDKDNNPIKAGSATLEQQKDGLRYMSEELLMRLHNLFGNRKDIRTNPVTKKLMALYVELMCK